MKKAIKEAQDKGLTGAEFSEMVLEEAVELSRKFVLEEGGEGPDIIKRYCESKATVNNLVSVIEKMYDEAC